MIASFYSEKTAEYSLVPVFSNLLSPLGVVAPIYYWKTREGNNISNILHSKEEVYIVAFFARRPKIDPYNIDNLYMKINSTLFEFSEKAAEFSIPVFCGLPLTTNIFELNNSKCSWFYLEPNLIYEDICIWFENKQCKDNKIFPLSQSEILDIVKNKSKAIPWSSAIEIINELHRQPNPHGHKPYPWWIRNWQYKPMYFIIKL